VCTPAFVAGEDTLAGWRGGWGVNILEEARHSSVLYLYRILFGYRYWKPLRYRMHPVSEWLPKKEWYSGKIVRESEPERLG
jgi:hypothetical protein